MADAAPAPRSAFADDQLVSAPGIARLADAGMPGRLLLRAAEADLDVVGALLGVRLPRRINWSEEMAGRIAMRLGPDEWLLLVAADGVEAAMAALVREPPLPPHALVDISHRNAGLIIEGPRVEDVLAAGCPLPLSLAAFPVGRATRTLVGKVEAVLRREAPLRFRIECGRSLAPYVGEFLGKAIIAETALARRSG